MTTTTDRPTVPEPSQPPKRRDRTHWLYIAVIVAVLAGVGVGIMAPDVGKSVGVLGTMFVALIKMMIAPVIFCTSKLFAASPPTNAAPCLPPLSKAAWVDRSSLPFSFAGR